MRLHLNSFPYHSFDYNAAVKIWYGMSRRGRYNTSNSQVLGLGPDEQAEENVADQERTISADDEAALAAIEDRANDYEEDDMEMFTVINEQDDWIWNIADFLFVLIDSKW